MNLFRLMRFFLPLQNPLGFTLPDFIALAVAIVFPGRRYIERAIRYIADKPRVAAGILFLLPMALRLSLLGNHPIPFPTVSDDFSYLLLGDTLKHFRLANPVHPMHRFFETVFVLQEPSYSSIYPIGQGIVLALFGSPWVGILISASAFSAACYWMLRGWVPPLWAFVGGLLAVLEFGPLNQWMNNYWGGALSAIAGCIVFGCIGRNRNGALLGIGLGLQILTRPFEALLLLFCLPRARPKLALLIGLAPALLLTAAHNKAVTGSFVKLPYMLSRVQYGIPTTFSFQQLPVPNRALTQEQDLDYRAQNDVHGDKPESLFTYLERLAGRMKFVRFFLLPPLYIAIFFAVFFALPRVRRPLTWIAIFLFGSNFYPYFYPHYIAAITCLFILIPIVGLAKMRPFPARLLLMLCGAHFLIWYGIHLLGNQEVIAAAAPYESWDYINFGDAEHRFALEARLHAEPGRQLVFVHYSPRHLLREWVYNDADIDNSPVVRALDLGDAENKQLIRYYPRRKTWMLEPDANPPRLSPYTPQ